MEETAYKALVRPVLEYICTVRDPYINDEVNIIEAVQRRAARFLKNRL